MNLKTFEPAGVSRRTGHPRVKVPGIKAPIDAIIAPYVKTLKDIGLHPLKSCGYESPYIYGETPDKRFILVIRLILKKQGFVESYSSEEGGLAYDKYDSSGHLIAMANADIYIGRNNIEKELGLTTNDVYEWSVVSMEWESLASEKGLKTIIQPFVEAIKEYFEIYPLKKRKRVSRFRKSRNTHNA
jgi:hypothetical protein